MAHGGMTRGKYIGDWDDQIPAGVSVTCGRCSHGVEMSRIGSTVEILSHKEEPSGSEALVVEAPYVCPRPECHSPSLLRFKLSLYMGRVLTTDVIGQIPRGTAKPMEHLPPAIEGDRMEAWSCFYGGDLRAAVIMGRAAIQRAARTLKAQGKGLKDELRNLEGKGIITTELRKWADEVRILGDDGAHPDELGKVEPEDAVDGLDFMDEFLRHAVALPAKRREREERRKSAA